MSEDLTHFNLFSLYSHQSLSDIDRRSRRFSEFQTHGFGMESERRRSSDVNSLLSFRMPRQSLQVFPVLVEKSQKLKNDHRLKAWQNYLDERRQLNERLATKLNRPIQSLIMNSIEAFRLKHEEQLIFDYITILDPPDPQRGSPAFWQLPIRLMPKCTDDGIPLEAQMDARTKCQIPEIEYIAIPNHIRHEMNTFDRTNKMVENWYNMPYRKEKIRENQKRLEYIQPHKPEMDDLIIIGHKLDRQTDMLSKNLKYSKALPIITITNPQEYAEDPVNSGDDLDDNSIFDKDRIVQLKIDNILLVPNCPSKTFEIIITTTELHKTRKQTVIFQNYGTITIYCYWRRILLSGHQLPVSAASHFPDIFIFDSSDFVIPPGQIYRLPFMVNPDGYGCIQENWILKTDPVFTQITFTLWANVEKADDIMRLKETLTNIPDKIEKVRKRLTIFNKLNIDLDANYSIPTYLITEEERFYYVNLDKKRRQYPKYFYQKHAINNLKTFHTNVFLSGYPKWDLNIDKMIVAIKEKYTLLSERHKILNELNSILESIKHIPTEKINIEFRKRRMVYNILCRIINDFVNDAIKLADHLNMRLPKVNYPEQMVPYQEFNVYKDEKQILFIENSDESLHKKCLKPIDHRMSVMDDKLRPPIKYKSRMKQSIDLAKPKDRYLIYKHSDHVNNGGTTQSASIKSMLLTKSKPIKAILPPKSLPASTPETKSELEYDTGSEQKNMNDKMEIYKEILHLKAYLHLSQACDEITSVIDSCNSSTRKPTLKLLKHLYDNLKKI